MATSPEYLRLAASLTRALADTALDSLRDAVVVIDARHPDFPVVLANAAARRCLANADPVDPIESPLDRWLGPGSASSMDYRWLESSYSSALDDPLIAGIVINSRDISERKTSAWSGESSRSPAISGRASAATCTMTWGRN